MRELEAGAPVPSDTAILHARIDALTAENADKSSESALLAAKIEELKSDAAVAAAELARITAERDALVHGLDSVKMDRDAVAAQVNSKQAIISEYEKQLTEAKDEIVICHGRLENALKDSPSMASGKIFECIRDVLRTAAAATDKQKEWDRVGCNNAIEALVVKLYPVDTSAARKKELCQQVGDYT